MQHYNTIILVVSLLTIISQAQSQFLDQLMNRLNNNYNNNNNNSIDSVNQPNDIGSRFRTMFKDRMSVDVGPFYDMVKNGSSMGINVLSGLVKVERGEEAERSGLTGRRPLSVRVFGIPVYERGTRVSGLSSDREPTVVSMEGEREKKPDGEELPIYTR